MLKIINTLQDNFTTEWDALRSKLSLQAELLDNTQRTEQVRKIINRVRQEGDDALTALTSLYDNVELQPQEFRIPPQQLARAHKQLDRALLAALRQAIENVRDYQQRIKLASPSVWYNPHNPTMKLGLRYTPLERVGICIPGASAPLVSTVIMTAVPAQVAGVKEIALISAPSCNGTINPIIQGLCYELQITDVYRISGAQAIAALAFGTEHIKKVDKIVGPSNWWGQLAKKEVFGLVDIDSFAGPSEVLIIADDTARPDWLAADMLSQAEHAPGSAILLTTSQSLAEAVTKQIETQLQALTRSEQARKYINEFSIAVVTRNMNQAVELSNEFAPEHLQIQCRNSQAVAEQTTNAGAIFIGQYSPVATGDYYAGPSHTLPTGSSAKFFSALSVNDFLKQTSIINLSNQALQEANNTIVTIAQAEGLDAHARSVTIRTETLNKETVRE